MEQAAGPLVSAANASPSTTIGAVEFVAPGGTNCGGNANQRIAVFGFERLDSAPSMKSLDGERRARQEPPATTTSLISAS
jgi:hypothetical protein